MSRAFHGFILSRALKQTKCKAIAHCKIQYAQCRFFGFEPSAQILLVNIITSE